MSANSGEPKGSITLILVILSVIRTLATLYQLILSLRRKGNSLTLREQKAANHYLWQTAQIEKELLPLGCVKGGVASPETEEEAEKHGMTAFSASNEGESNG